MRNSWRELLRMLRPRQSSRARQSRPLFQLAVNVVGRSPLVPPQLRIIILKLAGMHGLALRTTIESGTRFRTSLVSTGSGTTINYDCVFDNVARVTIGERCGIGIGVAFITSSHEYEDPYRRAGTERCAPITIGDGVWIGSRAVLLSGVSIGSGALIAAGAVVNKDVSSNTLAGGVPVRRLRSLSGTDQGHVADGEARP